MDLDVRRLRLQPYRRSSEETSLYERLTIGKSLDLLPVIWL